MDQAVLDQEGDMNTFNNTIYRITAHNFILAIKWKTCVLAFWCPVRVHLHGVVTRDVVHVNSGVREGSPPRRSYEECGSC